MKISILGNSLNLHSGHSKPAFDLAEALAARGHLVVVISSKVNESAVRSRLKRQNPNILIETPFDKQILDVEFNARKKSALVRALKEADIIHAFDYVDAAFVRRALHRRVPIVYTANKYFRWSLSDVINGGFAGLANLTRFDFQRALLAPSYLFRKAFNSFDAILCTSNFVRNALVQIGVNLQRIYRVPPWLGPPNLETSSNDGENHAVDFLYYGWGSNIRGVSDLLEAFSRLKRAYPTATLALHFTGRHGIEERLLSSRISSIEDAGVKLQGFSPAILNAVRLARCIVLPFGASFGYAQPPLTILESMALGRAIVSTDIASIPEVISHMQTGVLVPPRNPERLARAMAGIVESDNLARALGSNAKKRFEDDYAVGRVIAQIERTYLQILATG